MEAPKAPKPPIDPFDGKYRFVFDDEELNDLKEEYPVRMQEYKESMEKYKKDLAKYYEYKANEKAEEAEENRVLYELGNISIDKTPNVSTGEEELSNETPKIIPTHGVWYKAHLNILNIIKDNKDYNYLTTMAKKLLNDVIDKRNSNDNIMLHDGNQLWSFYVSKTFEHNNEDMRGYLRDSLIREAVKKARTKHDRTKHRRTKKGGSKRNKIRRKRTLRGGKDRGSPTTRPTYRASISREHFNELVRRNIERLARLEQERLARLERQRRNNIFGYQHLPTGQTALRALMDAQTERDRERERERDRNRDRDN